MGLGAAARDGADSSGGDATGIAAACCYGASSGPTVASLGNITHGASASSSAARSVPSSSRLASERSPVVSLAAGSLAGALQTVFWHPLDVLKTRLQVQDVRSLHTPRYQSLRHAILTMARAEGFRGFMRGVTPNILGGAVGWGVQMPLYGALKKAYAAKQLGVNAPVCGDLLCSLTSSGLTNVVVHPIFLVKTRLQLQAATRSADSARSYRGPSHAMMVIVKEEGFLGLYRGFGPSILLSSHGAVLLVAYDQFKALCSSTLAASSLAKITASIATYPMQVVRSVMQQRPVEGQPPIPQGIGVTIVALWRSAGPRAFYRGLSAQMLRTVPQAVAFFSLYEMISERLSRLWDGAPVQSGDTAE